MNQTELLGVLGAEVPGEGMQCRQARIARPDPIAALGFEVVEYLKTPPSREELAAVLAKLGMGAEDIVRKGEDVYEAEFKGRTLSEAEWLDALAAHPVLIERPIVVRGKRAVIGRPPEKVLELL